MFYNHNNVNEQIISSIISITTQNIFNTFGEKHVAKKCEENSAELYQKMYIKENHNFLKRNYHIKRHIVVEIEIHHFKL